jgi:hypothetical protein
MAPNPNHFDRARRVPLGSPRTYCRIVALSTAALAGLAALCPSAQAEEQLAAPRVFGIQLTPGVKYLAHDPVTGLSFGNAGGSPQTRELGLGVTLIFLPRGWPVSLTVGGAYAASPSKHYTSRYDGPFDESASTTELGVGVRKTFGRAILRGFVGTGLALCSASVRDDFAQGYESGGSGGSGAFVEAGGVARVRGLVDVGGYLRYSTFPFEWFPTIKAQHFDAGGIAVGLIVGFGP